MRRGCFCASYLEGESVLAGAEPHVLHGGAVDHHLSHISAGHKHWSAETKRRGFAWEKSKGKEQCFSSPPSLFGFCLAHITACTKSALCEGTAKLQTFAAVCTRWPFLNTAWCAVALAARENTVIVRELLGVCWWNSMHLVPPKQTQTFHFSWAKRVLFIHHRCICCGALLEEGFKQETSSWYLSLKDTLYETRRRSAFSCSILSLVPSGQRPQAWG